MNDLYYQPDNYSCHVTAWANLFRLAGYDVTLEDLWAKVGHRDEVTALEVVGVFGGHGLRLSAFNGPPEQLGCGIVGVDYGAFGHAYTWVGDWTINPKNLRIRRLSDLYVVGGGLRLDRPSLDVVYLEYELKRRVS